MSLSPPLLARQLLISVSVFCNTTLLHVAVCTYWALVCVYILDLGPVCGSLARLGTLFLLLDWELLIGRNSKWNKKYFLQDF